MTDQNGTKDAAGVTPSQLRSALAASMALGPATAQAIARKLAKVDFIGEPEDATATKLQAAIEAVTEGSGDSTGGAPKGQGARITHTQAIVASRAIRAAMS